MKGMLVVALVALLVGISQANPTIKSKPPTKCPSVDPLTHTVHLAHPTNCNHFYRCDHGQPKEEACPSTLHFNPHLQVCDWPNNAGCKADGGSGGDSKGSGSSDTSSSSGDGDSGSSSDSSDSIEKPPPTTTTTKAPTTRPTTPKPTTTKAPPSSESSSSSSSSSEETPPPRPPPTTTKAPPPPPPPPSSAPSSSDSSDTSSSSGDGDSGSSGPDGGSSGSGGSVSGPDDADPCSKAKCPSPDPLDHTVHLPHPSNCNRFCRCDHGKGKEDICPAGLDFNPKLQVCDWPSAAGCKS